MNLAENLQLLRREKGFSQEELAERLQVSRQAIGKWESGAACPELEKLLQLSDFYHTSLDRLVREDDVCNLSVRQQSGTGEELPLFLLRAKKATYAGSGAQTSASRPASHDLMFREGDWFYYDTYLGNERFCGEEAVWCDGKPLWSMNYSGRVTGENFHSDFLKAALSQGSEKLPYRGPVFFQQGDYSYHLRAEGNIDWFQGREEILYHNTEIYECYFHGGCIW